METGDVKARRRRGRKQELQKKAGGDEAAAAAERAQPWVTSPRAWAAALAVVACLLHSMHVAALFENDRFFSHLSPLERELSFRTEMGLYYSYYKTMVEAPSLPVGVASILHDNTTEYPATINTLQRFNLYPELCLSVLYRSYRWLLGVSRATGTTCFTISRGYGQSNIQACNGMGDSTYFYVHMIFALNGVVASAIALLGTYLSGSVWGGLFSLVTFFYNHGQATRVMWTPPLRESFAIPFLLLQNLALTHILRQRSISRPALIALVLSTLAFLLPWQFSQFTLLTQVLSVLVLHCLRLIPSHTFLCILSAIAVAFAANVVLQFANTMLLTSFLPSCLLACACVCLLSRLTNRLKFLPLIAVVEVCVVMCVSVLVKVTITMLLGSREDEHIAAILLSKFTSYHDFHTRLYTCSAEFDFISLSYVLELTWTLLLPMSLVVMALVARRVVRSVRWRVGTTPTPDNVEAPPPTATEDVAVQLYHVMQTLAYAVMAALIMRLKLFLTPQLAVLSGLLVVGGRTGKGSRAKRWGWWVCGSVLVLSSVRGWYNLSLQQSVIGEYNNPNGEELVHWIQDHTPQSAVFAGTMPTMATVLLTTGRPVVNHPHYENAGLRNRTKHVYTIFSHKPASEVHSILRGMGVDYVIVEDGWCRKNAHKPGCSFADMWDEEDPGNHGNPLFCEVVRSHTPAPFLQSFANSIYRVLQVAPSNADTG